MAREGLRTLVVAKKCLSEEQYQDFEVWMNTVVQYVGYVMFDPALFLIPLQLLCVYQFHPPLLGL